MRLLRVRLHHFRRFGEAVFTFDPRLNVLVGPNEAGKSTVRHAILTALFVNPATTAKRREEWRPWGSDSLGAVALEFEVDGRRYELRKDFERRKAELRDVVLGGTWEGPQVQERLHQALGFSTETLYRATAMIEQAEIASLHVGAADIGQRLSRIVQAGPGDAEAGAVIKRLEKDVGELEKGLEKPAKTPGTIGRLQDEVAALLAQQQEVQRRIERLEGQREELRRVRIEYEAAAQELQVKEALLAANKDYLTTEAELPPLRGQERQHADRITAIEKGYVRLREIARDLETLQAQGVPDDEAIAGLHAAQGRLQQQRAVVQEREVTIRTTFARIEKLAAAPPAGGWAHAAGPAGWVLLLLAAVAVAATAVLRAPWAITAGGAVILAGIGVTLLGIAHRHRRQIEAFRREREDSTLRLEEMRASLGAAEEALRREEEAFQATVAGTGSATAAEALSRNARLRELLREQTAVQSLVSAHLGGGALDGLREDLDRVRADILRRERDLTRPEAQAKRLTSLEFQRLEHEVRDLNPRVHRLQARQELLEHETAAGAPDYEVLVALGERIADRQEMLDATRRRARVYRAVREGLQTARQQTLIPARRLVEERAGEYLGLLTLGGYSGVGIEEPPLRITVWVPQAQQWMEPAEPALSRGTADQVYLAVRLALVEVLSEGRHPPLLLDDPFGTFDPARLGAAMAVLRRVSEVNQVLLFTCRPEYEAFGDHVVPLGEPAGTEPPGPLWQQPPPRTH